jgi:ADP-ribose pyrophosphatase YjhB (NUDIX family)
MMDLKTPLLTVDIVIRYRGGIVLIERKNAPHGWALPGGFVDIGESLEDAAMRESKEETSLETRLIEQFHAYSDPHRDSRFHTVSVVFIADGDGILQGKDDAKKADIFSEQELPDGIVFDHRKIISDYFYYIKSGKRPDSYM